MEAKVTSYIGRRRLPVVGALIDAVSWDTAQDVLLAWAAARESRYVCICNVHVVVSARSDQEFSHAVSDADMATPDGAPVAWTLRRKGIGDQPRINGPDLMWRLCKSAQDRGIKVGLYGSTDETLERLIAAMRASFPSLDICYVYSPPFRQLTEEEDLVICNEMEQCGVGFLFVGLGCPKQEKWMSAHRGKVHAVMIGVGAAFDYHAGTINRAPLWMQRNGLEWLYRLLSEPRRLWKRYFHTNSIFILLTIKEFLFGQFRTPR